MSCLGFGYLERLRVRGGEPQLDPLPRVVRDCRLGAAPSLRAIHADFRLKAEVVELLGELDRIGEGEIELLEFRHGLPCRIAVAVDARNFHAEDEAP